MTAKPVQRSRRLVTELAHGAAEQPHDPTCSEPFGGRAHGAKSPALLKALNIRYKLLLVPTNPLCPAQVTIRELHYSQRGIQKLGI